MKWFSFMGVLCLVACLHAPGLAAQDGLRIYNASLTDTSLSILYAGIDNEIVVLDCDTARHVEMIGTKDTIELSGTLGRFGVHPYGSMDTLRLVEQGNVIDRRIFSVRPFPSPRTWFGAVSDTLVTADEVLADPYLRVYLPECYLKWSEAVIREFNMRVRVRARNTCHAIRSGADAGYRYRCRKQEDGSYFLNFREPRDTFYVENIYSGELTMSIRAPIWVETCNHNPLPVQIQRVLHLLEPGDRLEFQSIKCFWRSDGCIRLAEPLTLTLR